MDESELCIDYGNDVQPFPPSKSPLVATQRPDAIDVATGALLARVARSGPRLFVSVSSERDEYLDLSSGASDLIAWDAEGNMVEKIVFEKAVRKTFDASAFDAKNSDYKF